MLKTNQPSLSQLSYYITILSKINTGVAVINPMIFVLQEWLPLGCVEQSTQKLDYCSMNITQLLTDNKACRCFLNATDSILSDQGFNCTNVTYQGDVPVPVAQLYFE